MAYSWYVFCTGVLTKVVINSRTLSTRMCALSPHSMSFPQLAQGFHKSLLGLCGLFLGRVGVPRTPDIGRGGRIKTETVLSGFAPPQGQDLSGLRAGIETGDSTHVRIGIRP